MSEADVDVIGGDDVLPASKVLRKSITCNRKKRRKRKLGLYQSRNKETILKKRLRRKKKGRKLDPDDTIAYSDVAMEIDWNDSKSTIPFSEIHESMSSDVHSDVNENATGEMKDDVSTGGSMSDPSHEASTRTYVDVCMDQLVYSTLLLSFITLLDANNCLRDFMSFVQLTVEGKLHVRTIPFLLCMDLAKFMSLKTTTQMVYREQTKKFWQAVYRFGGGTVLRLMSGMKNFGQVCMKKCKKSLYDPLLARINFAVPDLKTITSGLGLLRDKIPCGFIQETIDMLDRNKEYNLCVDGKKISPGCTGNNEGDINLFGFEGPPNLQEQNERLQSEEKYLEKIIDNEEQTDNGISTKADDLLDVLQIATCRIKDLRTTNVNHELLKLTFEKSLAKESITLKKFTQTISSIETYQVFSTDLIERILRENKNICGIMAQMKNNYSNFEQTSIVDLAKQSNTLTLLPPDQIIGSSCEELPSEHVKQGSDEWIRRRKESLVTSSTTYKALGLDTLGKMNEHFKEYVLGEKPQDPSDDQKRMFQHGRENEINAFGTLAGTVLPAIFPNCKKLKQVGSYYMDGDIRKNIMCVSPDAVITTPRKSVQCTNGLHGDDIDMSVEFKSPMGEKKFVMPVHYQIPKYYVPQVLLQMKVLNLCMGLYCTHSKQSFLVLLIQFDEDLWRQIWKATKEMYDKVTLKKIARCAVTNRNISAMIGDFVKNKCSIVVEVPSCTTVDHNYMYMYSANPYICGFSKPKAIDHAQTLKVNIVEACKRMQKMINEVNEMERRKATELLMISVNDTDRIFDPDSYHTLPIAYLLKGYSLNVETMRKILDIVMDRMKSEGISIVTQSFDGQWHNLAVKGHENVPLTKLQLQKQVWSKLGRITKENMLKWVDDYTKVSKQDLENCSSFHFLTNGQHIMGNLKIQQMNNNRRILSAFCCGGSSGISNVMNKLIAPTPEERPDVWMGKYEEQRTPSATDSKMVNMNNDGNILTLLPQEFLQSSTMQSAISTISEIAIGEDGELDPDDYLPDLIPETSAMERGLLHTKPEFLQEVLVGLCAERRGHVWKSFTVQDFYSKILCNEKQIERMTSYEMDVINNVFNSYKQQHLFTKSTLKSKKTTILCKLFSSARKVPDGILKNTKKVTLRKLSLNVIRKHDYPTHVLAVAIANMHHNEMKPVWIYNATVPMSILLPESDIVHEAFSYPEYVAKRNSIECRLMDPTHILTNIRTHICTRGYSHVKREAFLRVSEKDNSLLNRAYIVNIVDKQCAAIAQRFFSSDVQAALLENGDMQESDFVGLVRHWYEAVDERGFPVPVRLHRMQAMYDHLTSLIKFDVYPPPKQYISGIPIVTFEALLHNISTRIQLYGLTKNNTYNHRSISTLSIETLFSILSRMDGSYNGCPKSTMLSTMLKKLIQMYQLQADPDKIFDIHVSNKKKYPDEDLMSADDMDELDLDKPSTSTDSNGTNGNVYNLVYRSHKFDRRFQRTRKKNTKNVDIPTGNQQLRREGGVREHFKTYDSKIKSTTRHGLPN